MSEPLWQYLRLKAENDEKLKEAYRKVFVESYVKSEKGAVIKLYDWRGKRVHFSLKIFDHAFSESSDYRFNPGIHDKPFSKKRARCIMWIKEVLSGTKGTIECYHQTRRDSRNRPKKRRLLLVVEERYLVVLEERSNHEEYDFISAFPAEKWYLEKILKESVLVESKKPQS